MGAFRSADDLVKFELDRDSVAMLAVLNNEKHDDRYDRRRSADDELPRIVEMKHKSEHTPNQNDQKRQKPRERFRGLI